MIGIVAVIVIGPKDLPRVLRTVTLGMRKIRAMARDFQDSIDELAREAELHELRKEIEKTADADIEKELQSIVDPAREMEESVREIGRSLDEPAAPETPPPAVPEPSTAAPAAEEPVQPAAAPAAPAQGAGGKKAGEAP